VVVDNCIFDGTSHVHLKGGYRWWIKNSRFSNVSAGDFNDHHIYIWSNLSSGNEAVIEYNYFESPWAGAAIHVYGLGNQVAGEGPDYIIIRYNIFNGKSSDYWGIALWGGYCTIVGNTVYGTHRSLQIGESSPHNEYNAVVNNIFSEYSGSGAEWSSGEIQNLTFNNNLVYSTNSQAYSSFYPAGTGSVVSGNITDAGPSFIQENPSHWHDFQLQSNSPAINTGTSSLDSTFNSALGTSNTTWPPAKADQNSYGSDWEIGAFVYDPSSVSLSERTSFIAPERGVRIQFLSSPFNNRILMRTFSRSKGTIRIFDMTGRRVASIPIMPSTDGSWTYQTWDGQSTMSGIYYIECHAGGHAIGQRTMLPR
jgi:hypothetical protein